MRRTGCGCVRSWAAATPVLPVTGVFSRFCKARPSIQLWARGPVGRDSDAAGAEGTGTPQQLHVHEAQGTRLVPPGALGGPGHVKGWGLLPVALHRVFLDTCSSSSPAQACVQKRFGAGDRSWRSDVSLQHHMERNVFEWPRAGPLGAQAVRGAAGCGRCQVTPGGCAARTFPSF